MGNNASYVSTGKPKTTGGVYVAPKGTVVSDDPTSALDPEVFTHLGFVSEDGLENTNDMETSEIKTWEGLVAYRSQNGFTDAFKFALLESENINVLKTVYGENNVTLTDNGDIKVKVGAGDPEEKVWVFELSLRNGLAKRIVVHTGAVTSREAITYNASDAIKYGLTVTAYADSNGDTHYEYQEKEGASI